MCSYAATIVDSNPRSFINQFDYENPVLSEFVRAIENSDREKLKELFANHPERTDYQDKWQFYNDLLEHFDLLWEEERITRLWAFRDRCVCYTDKISVGFTSSVYPKLFGVVFEITDTGNVRILSNCNFSQFRQYRVNNSMGFFHDEPNPYPNVREAFKYEEKNDKK